MEQTITPARKIIGQARVPGERAPAERALLLAALAQGDSRIRHAPPSVSPLVEILRQLGIAIEREKDLLLVQGAGLRGFGRADAALDLEGLEEMAPLVLALLAGQEFVSRVRLGSQTEYCRPLLNLLARLGMEVRQETDELFAAGKGAPRAIAQPVADLELPLKLALLVAALFAEGTTVLTEPLDSRSRAERFLRERQVAVERRREGEQYLVSIPGGQVVQALDVEVPGDLRLAYPLIAAALARKGSQLTLEQVAVHAGERSFLDLLRQIGARIEIEEKGEELCDLHVRFSQLKPTRVAGQRTEKVIDQVALLAVLATQAQGEVVIRDLEGLRQGRFDYVAHLFESLRLIEARAGEFPEGIVVKGGYPLKGGRLDSRGDAGLAAAFAVAGLLAEGEMTIAGAECLDPVYPGFFDTLHTLQEARK
jgi:3-phosphoshikimate 1-carboxyvinyltransferase